MDELLASTTVHSLPGCGTVEIVWESTYNGGSGHGGTGDGKRRPVREKLMPNERSRSGEY